ncbi:hypothetical protein CSKR_102589 [Clonorchis sinensis]|uniref:Uncharacterized protein n=1 Tax=Clonorchis sinensis TaxID=79923 RepID=A0A3R7D7B1_CLOSI|nr:hypothetical protein CSKR_102589 [Clonorchis sinensis]
MGDEIVNSEVGLQFLKLRWKAETGEGITSNVKALLIRYQLKIQYRFSELKFRNQACNGRHGERIFDETMFGFVTTKFSGGAFTKGIIELYNFNARTNIHR